MVDTKTVTRLIKSDGHPPIEESPLTKQTEIEHKVEKPGPVITFTEKPSIFAGDVWGEQTLSMQQDGTNARPDKSTPYTALLPEMPFVERV